MDTASNGSRPACSSEVSSCDRHDHVYDISNGIDGEGRHNYPNTMVGFHSKLRKPVCQYAITIGTMYARERYWYTITTNYQYNKQQGYKSNAPEKSMRKLPNKA